MDYRYFSEKKLRFKRLRHFLLTLFCIIFGICLSLLLFSYLMTWTTNILVVPSTNKLAYFLSAVESYWIEWRWYHRFSLKNRGCNVFVHIGSFFKLLKKKNSFTVKKFFEIGKAITQKLKSSFLNGFETFSRSIFFEFAVFPCFLVL